MQLPDALRGPQALCVCGQVSGTDREAAQAGLLEGTAFPRWPGGAGMGRPQHRHLPAAKFEPVTATAQGSRRDTGQCPDVPERQEHPDPEHGRVPGVSVVGRSPPGKCS